MQKVKNAQEVIYRYICQKQQENGYPPTVREICEGVGLSSPASVHRYLNLLAEEGLIQRGTRKNRAYAVRDQIGISEQTVPLLGKVAAGTPILSEENREDEFPIPRLLLHGSSAKEAFMLRVDGDSMQAIGIDSGDIIVVEQCYQVSDGDIVVARIDREEVTVKRFYKKNDIITLQPENPDYSPMHFDASRVEILGRVTGLMRSY